MNYNTVYEVLDSHTSAITFAYRGKNCGVDPFSDTNFDVWYGDASFKAESIEEVFHNPYFDGKSLKDIFCEIEIDF